MPDNQGMYGINDYLDACGFRKDFLEEQQQWMRLERVEFEQDAQRLEAEHDRVRQELAGYLIPEVTDEYITDLEERLAFTGLLEIKRGYEEKFAQTEYRTVELEGMDEIQDYEQLIALARQAVQQYQPEYDEVKSETRAWGKSKWFSGLFEKGYFDADYSPGLFRRFFDWRAVSFLMSDVKKNVGLDFRHPDDLKKHFRELHANSKRVDAEYGVLTDERDRIDRLHAEYQTILSAPERLLADLYRDMGSAAIEHLRTCPEAVRLRLAGEDPNLNKFLQRDAGMRKQSQYLRELSVARIDSRLQQTDMEIAKTDQKIQKLEMKRRRGKYKHYSKDDIERVRNVKAEKWERRRLKTAKLRRKISEFDRYDKGSCSEEYLWWDLFTNAAPADDIYEVREHRRRRPNWNYRDYRDPFDQDDEPVMGVFDDAAEDLASSMIADNDDGLFDPS